MWYNYKWTCFSFASSSQPSTTACVCCQLKKARRSAPTTRHAFLAATSPSDANDGSVARGTDVTTSGCTIDPFWRTSFCRGTLGHVCIWCKYSSYVLCLPQPALIITTGFMDLDHWIHGREAHSTSSDIVRRHFDFRVKSASYSTVTEQYWQRPLRLLKVRIRSRSFCWFRSRY